MKPYSASYPMIYREAAEVHWDSEGRFLYSPKPREWSYFDWFFHILQTADPEGERLVLTENTVWRNFPDSLRSEIENWMEKRRP